MKTQADLMNENSKAMVMHQTKIDAFLIEFPFTKKYLDNKPLRQVYVSKIEPTFLDYAGLSVNVSPFWKFSGEWQKEKIMFFDKWGNTLRFVRCGTEIGTILKSMEPADAEMVFYILSYFENTAAAILYKVPKGYSLLSWIDAQIKKERQQFCDEINTIDIEGERIRQGLPLKPKPPLNRPVIPPLPTPPKPPKVRIVREDFTLPMPEKPE